MLPVFIGIGLGVLLGSIPLFVRLPAALRLGLAGGPLMAALILGRIRRYRQACTGLCRRAPTGAARAGDRAVSGGGRAKIGVTFSHHPDQGDGLAWIGYGIFITAIPLLTVSILAPGGQDELSDAVGMLAGSMTDPPALAFANGLHPTSGAAALSYATVYPLVMFLRIIAPQLLGGCVLDAVTLPGAGR
ncbi:hypothetical protein M8494_32735 [Serratia ureilytica]